MVRCMIQSHNQKYWMTHRGDDAEDMCGTALEPDPRYPDCCSKIFRPGRVLRDVIVGFLVVVAVAIVVAVLFVVCFYLLQGPNPAFVPSTHLEIEDALEVVSAPSLDTTPTASPTEHPFISVFSDAGPISNTDVKIEPENNVTTQFPVMVEELQGGGRLPPLLDALTSHQDAFTNAPDIIPGEQQTENPEEPLIDGALQEVSFPEESTEEALTLTEPQPELPSTTEEKTLITDITVDSSAVTGEASQGTCHHRQLEMCSNLPYSLTAFPNWVNDQNERQLQESSLPFLRDVIVRSRCSPRAQEYACTILEPPCNADGTILPPCRTFCRSVASTCQEFIISGVGPSGVFNCERFPDSTDPAVCFDMTQAPGDVLGIGRDFNALLQLPSPNLPQDFSTGSDYATEESNNPSEEYAVDYPDYEAAQNIPGNVDYHSSGFNPTAVDLSTTETDPVVPHDNPLASLDSSDSNVNFSADYPTEIPSSAGRNTDLEGKEGTEDNIQTDTVSGETVNPTKGLSGSNQSLSSEGDFSSITTPEIICDHEKFLCHDGLNCLVLTSVCDGMQQCHDGSDESNCTHIELDMTVPSSVPTEAHTSFFNTDDEKVMTSVPEETTTITPLEETDASITLPPEVCPELQCLDGTCLALSQLNNGVKDCSDGTDEEDFDELFA